MKTFQAALDAPADVRDALLYFFLGDRLLVTEDGALPSGLPQDFGVGEVQYLGRLEGRPAFGAQAPAELPAEFHLRRLRSLHEVLPEDQFALAGFAYQIVEWDRTHRFCGACATPTGPHPHERAKRCPNCGLTNYPRLAPAVMVLITRGDELLLARSPHFPPGMYSANAGFVEPGETLEECGEREVREEVGLEVTGLRYFSSQPWPYPHSLMVAFTAEYAGGEIQVDGTEIEDARWFHREALPQLPGTISIARALIDAVVARRA